MACSFSFGSQYSRRNEDFLYIRIMRGGKVTALCSFTFSENLFEFYRLQVLPVSKKPYASRTFHGSGLGSRGLGLDYLDCNGDTTELIFRDEGPKLFYKLPRVEDSSKVELHVLQSHFFLSAQHAQSNQSPL